MCQSVISVWQIICLYVGETTVANYLLVSGNSMVIES